MGDHRRLLDAVLSEPLRSPLCRLSLFRGSTDPRGKKRIYAIMDNLEMHHCRDLLLFMIHHERWEFVYQPTYATYLDLIEPWWKVFDLWRSKASVLRLGSRSKRRCRRPPPIGMPISIPLSGGAVAGTNHLVFPRRSPSR